MDEQLKAFCTKVSDEGKLDVNVVDFWYFPPTPFDKECIDAIRNSAKRNKYSHRDIISGAGHDAVYLAGIAPAGMIFVPCEDGISHNEIENATPEDCAAGCQVLLDTILERAGAVD